MVPDDVNPVAPEITPAVDISRAVESSENESPPSPKSTCPFASSAPLVVVVPVTVNVEDAVVGSAKVIEEDPESIVIFPVVEPPIVKLLPDVV